MPTFGSLFAGIGGFDLGLERAGWTPAWQVEIDPFCTRVLAKHWPNVPRFQDVRDVGSHNLASVDLVCGGFPCQPVSRAGSKRFEADPRWLWPEVSRIVFELRPKWLLLENAAELTHRGLGPILSNLAQMGYNAEWGCLSAETFGAFHERQRTFLVAYPDGTRFRMGVGSGRGTLLHAQWNQENTTQGWSDVEFRYEGPVKRPYKSGISGVVDGISDRLDRTRTLGNAVVPQIVELLGREILKNV